MPKPAPSTYDRALRLLGFRARSAAELRRKLIRGGAEASDAEEVVERLRAQKVLDDDLFALNFARSKLVGSGASRRRVLQELARKGVARDAAERALASLLEEEGVAPHRAIGRLVARKWQSLRGLDDVTRRRRLYAFLARRGFDPDEIRSAMSEVGAEPDA